MTTTEKIAAIIEESNAMKKAYFWNPPANAAGRRYYEKKHSHKKIEWEEGGHHYTAEFSVSCSCRNIYAKGFYFRDGKRTTITAIRNSYNRLMQQENSPD